MTNYQQGSVVTVASTIVRTLTDGQQTSYWTTTASSEAFCHSGSSEPSYDNPQRQGDGRGGARAGGRGGNTAEVTREPEKRDSAATAAVAAITSTTTETTYTVTRTIVTTIPAGTTTEVGKLLKSHNSFLRQS